MEVEEDRRSEGEDKGGGTQRALITLSFFLSLGLATEVTKLTHYSMV